MNTKSLFIGHFVFQENGTGKENGKKLPLINVLEQGTASIKISPTMDRILSLLP